MAIFKKKDDGKKPMAKASKPAPKASKPIVKAKVVVKAKPMPKAKPTVKAKPFSPMAQEVGHRAAEESRRFGRINGPISNAADRAMQGILNAGGKKYDSKGVKRSKTGGVIDPTGRYSGLNNKQLGYE